MTRDAGFLPPSIAGCDDRGMTGLGGRLFYGDNLDVLTRHIQDESVDLIYLDPPFNSARDYNLLFSEHDGTRSAEQVKAFKDTWEWDATAVAAYRDLVQEGGKLSETMQAFRLVVGDSVSPRPAT